MKYLLSIITINRNNAEGLKRTIESVFSQSYKNFEYIVIDGASTDESREVILDNEENISYWVSEKDKGIYHAMNKGIKACSGDFVLFLNSGDFLYDNNVIENVIENLSDENEIVYGDVLLRSEKNNWEKIQIHPEELRFSYFYSQTICQQACFIKKSLFEKTFYYNEEYKIVSDWEFFIYAIFIARAKTKKINQVISIYDATGISGNTNFRPLATAERQKTIDTYFRLYREDYQELISHGSNRSQQLVEIEKSKFFRKIVSVFFNIIMLFLPGKK